MVQKAVIAKKDPAAVRLGRRGGERYAKNHTAEERKAQARKAALARWVKAQKTEIRILSEKRICFAPLSVPVRVRARHSCVSAGHGSRQHAGVWGKTSQRAGGNGTVAGGCLDRDLLRARGRPQATKLMLQGVHRPTKPPR